LFEPFVFLPMIYLCITIALPTLCIEFFSLLLLLYLFTKHLYFELIACILYTCTLYSSHKHSGLSVMNVSSPPCIVDTTPSIHPTLYTAMRRYYTQGTSIATQRSFKAGIRLYAKFCRTFALWSIPTSERTLLLFSTYLATCGLSYATIRVYLSAVRHTHVPDGMLPHFWLSVYP